MLACASKVTRDMDTSRNDKLHVSINNTTAINIYKACMKLGGLIFDR